MRSTIIRGSRLQQMIGITATSSVVNQINLQRSVEQLSNWNLTVAIADQVRLKKRYLAGPDKARASALDAFARDPLVGTIWCARGGYGATRILPFLEEMKTAEALRKNPKLLIGYSDVTALHLYFYSKLGIPSLHAVMPGTPRFANLSSRLSKLLRSTLAGELALGKKSYTTDWTPQHFLGPRKEAEGIKIGRAHV